MAAKYHMSSARTTWDLDKFIERALDSFATSPHGLSWKVTWVSLLKLSSVVCAAPRLS